MKIIQVGGLGFIGAALSISASRVVQSFFYWLCLGRIVFLFFEWIVFQLVIRFWDFLFNLKFQAAWKCWELPNYLV